MIDLHVKSEKISIFFLFFSKIIYNIGKKIEVSLMYTVYVIFIVVLVLSFLTGIIVLISERKNKKKRLILDKGRLIDEEVL